MWYPLLHGFVSNVIAERDLNVSFRKNRVTPRRQRLGSDTALLRKRIPRGALIVHAGQYSSWLLGRVTLPLKIPGDVFLSRHFCTETVSLGRVVSAVVQRLDHPRSAQHFKPLNSLVLGLEPNVFVVHNIGLHMSDRFLFKRLEVALVSQG